MGLSLKSIVYEVTLYVANRIVARVPSHGLRKFYYRNFLRAKIGPGSFIFMDAWFDTKGGVTLGTDSVVNQKCRLDGRGGLTIGDHVSISSEVCILTADHDVQSPDFTGRNSPVTIEDYVFIGTRAMILPGVTIGKGAVVAAGSVVTKSVAPFAIVAGVPAKVIGQRNQDLHYKIDYGRLWW